MTRFVAFSKGNNCPLCGGAIDCRYSTEDPDFIQCYGYASAQKGEKINGYVCVKEQTGGHTASFKPDNSQEWTEENKRQWEIERQRRQQKAKEESEQRVAQQMSAVERDKWYKTIFSQLTLTDSDRQLLLDRGLTPEQIELDGYKSVVPWQNVGKPELFPRNIPGLLGNGNLNIPASGIIAPIRNHEGLIVSCNVRLHDGTEGRYRWLTSSTKKNPNGATSHLYGELPLGVYEPDAFTGDSIWLTEGTTFKPSITRYKLGVPVVGASSGLFDGSPEFALASIDYLSDKYQTKLLTIAVDAGDVTNKKVTERWNKQFRFLEELGYTCRIAWWNQVTKDDCDIDELTDLSVIKYITIQEFKELVIKHQTPSGTGFKTKQTSNDGAEQKQDTQPQNEENKPDWGWLNWLENRTFTPDIKLNQSKLSLPQLADTNAIIGIKSGLGTGKTEALLEVIKYSERGAVILGYRNNLLWQTINRGSQNKVNIYHIQEIQESDRELLIDEHTNKALCLDSIHRVDGYFKGVDIFLDETCSVLIHAINGGTLQDSQAKAIKILTKALNDCNRVFLLDGNLSDTYVNFIARIAPNKKVIKIENTQGIPQHNITIVDGVNPEEEIKKRDRSPLIKELCKPDVIPWIFADSKERTKVIETILTDAGKKGYVLNSETAAEDWAKEFLLDPNAFINKYKPDFTVISPTAESGVSVTVNNYFTHKFSFFAGVQGTNSQHQAMFRLRDNTIPHYVFCPETSMIRDRSTPLTYSFKQYQQVHNERIMQSANLCSQAGEDPDRILEVIFAAIKRQNDDWWTFSSVLGANDNYEMDNLRKCLVHALEEAGHNVKIESWEISPEVKELEQAAKEKVQLTHAKELYEAQEFSSIEEAKNEAKKNPKKEKQRRVEKTFFLDRIPEIKETDVYGVDFILQCHIQNKHFISQQQRYWLVQNFEVSQKRHESAWFYQATSEDFFSARVKRMSHDVIWALRELNILQFEGKEYHKHSIEVETFIKTLRERKDIQLALNIRLKPETETRNENIEILGKLLDLVGLKNSYTSKKMVEIKYSPTNETVAHMRLRHYQCQPTTATPEPLPEGVFNIDKARLVVLEAIERKLVAWMESDKSKVDWSPAPQPEQEPAATVATPPTLAELAAAQLRALTNWGDCTLSQEEINLGWELLTLQEQNTLHQLFEDWRQSQASQQENTNNVVQQAIDTQASIKEVGFGAEHFRSYHILSLLSNGLALVKQCFGAKQECQMPLNQLLIAI